MPKAKPEVSAEIGIIGGTGSFPAELLENAQAVRPKTPYGSTSDRIVVGSFEGRRVALLPRHGPGHSIPPHMINFRANIWALKKMGVDKVFATTAVGSLNEDYAAGDAVIPDQFIDWGKTVHTFYNGPEVCHVSMADPFCPELRKILISSAKALGLPTKDRGTYLRIEGPQFSTRAASRMYRQFADIIGMTASPEAILCREQGMCFAVLASVTDYDAWKEHAVSMEGVKSVMAQNVETARIVLGRSIAEAPRERSCGCGDALKYARA